MPALSDFVMESENKHSFHIISDLYVHSTTSEEISVSREMEKGQARHGALAGRE